MDMVIEIMIVVINKDLLRNLEGDHRYNCDNIEIWLIVKVIPRANIYGMIIREMPESSDY